MRQLARSQAHASRLSNYFRAQAFSTLLRTCKQLLLSSCSQTATTFQPMARSIRRTFLSRFLFLRILFNQNIRFVEGMERQRLQPCQKQPSKKIATRARAKTTSGLPVRPESCPSFQPLTPDRIRSDRNFHSVVFVPRDLLRLMTRERAALLNVSKSYLPGCKRPFLLPKDISGYFIVPTLIRAVIARDA
jgi:hypothetical protein